MRCAAPAPGYPTDEQRVAWFRQVLVALAGGDVRLLRVAQRELRRLGLWVAPVASLTQPNWRLP